LLELQLIVQFIILQMLLADVFVRKKIYKRVAREHRCMYDV